MVFGPSKAGRNNSPADHTDFTQLEHGANTLLQTVLQLA